VTSPFQEEPHAEAQRGVVVRRSGLCTRRRGGTSAYARGEARGRRREQAGDRFHASPIHSLKSDPKASSHLINLAAMSFTTDSLVTRDDRCNRTN
jgi:hypothetical protein